jgi:hypothetical protein
MRENQASIQLFLTYKKRRRRRRGIVVRYCHYLAFETSIFPNAPPRLHRHNQKLTHNKRRHLGNTTKVVAELPLSIRLHLTVLLRRVPHVQVLLHHHPAVFRLITRTNMCLSSFGLLQLLLALIIIMPQFWQVGRKVRSLSFVLLCSSCVSLKKRFQDSFLKLMPKLIVTNLLGSASCIFSSSPESR